MKIKICGNTRPEDAAYVAQLGADFVGVVMKSEDCSPRSVDAETARAIFAAVGPGVKTVVITHTTCEEDLDAIALAHPDYIQMTHPFVIRKDWPWKVIRVIGRGMAIPTDCDMVAVDESMGAGIPFDPAFAARVVRESALPVMLCGGINSENVGQAISEVKPAVIDLCSGLEASPGKKDRKKMDAFFEAVRRAIREE